MTCAAEMPAGPHELVLDRILDAPRDRIWQLWTDPTSMEEWFCPKPWHVTDAVIDLKPGGRFSSVMHGPDGERFDNTGVLLEMVEGRRLVFTDAFAPGWIPNGRPFMVAEITLDDAGGGRTRYVARVRHWTAEARKEHEEMGFHDGWNTVADQLEALARTL